MSEEAAVDIKPEFNLFEVVHQIGEYVNQRARERVGGYGGPRPKTTVKGDGNPFYQIGAEWLGHYAGINLDTTQAAGMEPVQVGSIYGGPLANALVDSIQAVPKGAEPGKVFRPEDGARVTFAAGVLVGAFGVLGLLVAAIGLGVLFDNLQNPED